MGEIRIDENVMPLIFCQACYYSSRELAVNYVGIREQLYAQMVGLDE